MKRAKRKAAKSSGKTPASEDEAVILQFRIWLKDVNPMVWRRVQVASTMTLREFALFIWLGEVMTPGGVFWISLPRSDRVARA